MVKKCVIDIGSNTIKLFIADLIDNKVISLENKRRMARLAKDLANTGQLAPDSKDITIKYIAEYLELCKKHGVNNSNILLTATAAARNASDGPDFIAFIKNKFKLPHLKILSGAEEAEYSYMGAIESFPPDDTSHYCLLDVGGGSFQICYGLRNKLIRGTSEQIGANRACEEFELHKTIPQKKLESVINFFKRINIKDFEIPIQPLKVIGIGGTIKIMQLMLKNQDDYTPLKVDELLNTAYMLGNMTVEERFKWFTNKYQDKQFCNDTGLTKSRAQVILAGLCIVLGLTRKLEAREIFLSHTDAKDYIIRMTSF